jgi:hypothetical protein
VIEYDIYSERFWSKVYINEDNPDACWFWIAGCNKHGYGTFHCGHSTYRAHRFAYQELIGKLEPALQINHKCNNIICVNPWHLYQGSQVDNVHDMLVAGTFKNLLVAKAVSKTHCPQGHLLNGKNLVTSDLARGYRHCRICQNERRRDKRINKL